jgi:hypothetical protein
LAIAKLGSIGDFRHDARREAGRALSVLVLLLPLVPGPGCSDDVGPIQFGTPGSLSGAAGRGAAAQRKTYGGTGPMTPEVGFETDSFCTKVPAP